MTSIALIQLTDRHTEVFGGLIALFSDLFKHIHIYYTPYSSDYSHYYKKALKHEKSTIYLHHNENKQLKPHNLYVFVTGYDYITEYDRFNHLIDSIPKSQLLLLSHHSDEYEELKELRTSGVFAITPVYKSAPCFLTYSDIPLKTFKPMKNNKINILLSGFTNPFNKDLNGFTHMLRQFARHRINCFKFHVVNYYPIPEFEDFGDLCKVYVDSKASDMIRLLSHVDYVMTLTKKNSSYHKKQLTGIIPLAVSMGVPLIVDKDLARIYGLSSKNSIIYEYPKENSVTTIKDTVLSLVHKQNRYKTLRKNMIVYRNRMVHYYKGKMKKYLNKLKL